MGTIILTSQEKKRLAHITTPEAIQDLLDSIPFNHERHGETCFSAYAVLRHNKAHCMEGAFLAYYLLANHGYSPRILSLKVQECDDDHVVTLFKKDGYFGAISKTNHGVLSYRDPVYRTVRELAMSYFHEYFLPTTGEKTMIGYSSPISLSPYKGSWIHSDENQFLIAYHIFSLYHNPITEHTTITSYKKANKAARKGASIPLS